MLLEFQRDFAAAIGEPAEGAMSIYRNTVLSGCVDALRANYPVVARLLGDEMFEAVAVEHASQYPPRRPVLALYGARLPDWLAEQSWLHEIPYLPHVARIERLHIESLFASDEDPLEMAQVDLRIQLTEAAPVSLVKGMPLSLKLGSDIKQLAALRGMSFQ